MANQCQLFVNGRLHHGNARRLTESINDLSTWINFAKRSPKWGIQCVDFLLSLVESDQRLRDLDGKSVKHLQETLSYMRDHCEASLDVAGSSAAQMQSQLDIVSIPIKGSYSHAHSLIFTLPSPGRRSDQCPNSCSCRKRQHFN
jgi:hypothetical protein